MPLEKFERETIINFNEEENLASVFTFNRAWQRHLEQKLGLVPLYSNRFGGREYELPKSQIPLPRKVRKASKAQLEGLAMARQDMKKPRKTSISTVKIKRERPDR